MARHGCSLLDSRIQKILTLLATTSLSLMDIARSTGRERRAIAAVNRRFHIRDYVVRRNTWALNCDLDDVVKSSSELNTTPKAA